MDYSQENDRPLALRAWLQINDEIMFWNNKSTEKKSEADKQLLAVAFLLIPITGSIVLTDISLISPLTFILGLSLVFFLGSIIFGFLQLSEDAKHFYTYQRDNTYLSNAFKSSFLKNPLTIKEIYEKYEGAKKDDDIPPLQKESDDKYRRIQQWLLGLGVFGIILIILGLLFYPQHTSYYGTILLHGKSYQIQIQKNN